MAYDLENSLGYWARIASKSIGQALMKRFAEAGHKLTIYHWMALTYLYKMPPVNQQQLGEFCGKDKAGITRIVDALEAGGCAKRVQNPRDRRSNWVEITDHGRAFTEELHRYAEETLHDALTCVSAADMETTLRVLQKVSANVKVCTSLGGFVFGARDEVDGGHLGGPPETIACAVL